VLEDVNAALHERAHKLDGSACSAEAGAVAAKAAETAASAVAQRARPVTVRSTAAAAVAAALDGSRLFAKPLAAAAQRVSGNPPAMFNVLL
jgi:hypothetical protein